MKEAKITISEILNYIDRMTDEDKAELLSAILEMDK